MGSSFLYIGHIIEKFHSDGIFPISHTSFIRSHIFCLTFCPLFFRSSAMIESSSGALLFLSKLMTTFISSRLAILSSSSALRHVILSSVIFNSLPKNILNDSLNFSVFFFFCYKYVLSFIIVTFGLCFFVSSFVILKKVVCIRVFLLSVFFFKFFFPFLLYVCIHLCLRFMCSSCSHFEIYELVLGQCN